MGFRSSRFTNVQTNPTVFEISGCGLRHSTRNKVRKIPWKQHFDFLRQKCFKAFESQFFFSKKWSDFGNQSWGGELFSQRGGRGALKISPQKKLQNFKNLKVSPLFNENTSFHTNFSLFSSILFSILFHVKLWVGAGRGGWKTSGGEGALF